MAEVVRPQQQPVDVASAVRPEGLPDITLYITAYAVKHAARRAEYVTSVTANCSNACVTSIVVLAEPGVDWLPKSSKLSTVAVTRRPTYSDIFKHAGGRDRSGITIIANTDIVFDSTLSALAGMPMDGVFMALSRWDWDATNREYRVRRKSDSQDAWVFSGPCRISGADFCLGTPGCDNRIAAMAADAGYKVVNPARAIRSLHIHGSAYRTYNASSPRVNGSYASVSRSQLSAVCSEPTRVMHVALRGATPQPDLEAALSAMGPCVRIDWRAVLRRDGKAGLQREIIRVCKEHRPRFTFMQIQAPDIILPETVDVICGIKVNWTGDVRSPLPDWYKQLGSRMSLTVFTNGRDAAEMRRCGLNADVLPIGFDPSNFNPNGPADPEAPEIVFMGNHYPGKFPLSGFRLSVVTALQSRYGRRFGVYGSYPGAVKSLMGDTAAESAVYRGCKLAIDIGHFTLPRYASGRLFRTTGSGACTLVHMYPGIEHNVVPGTHVFTWSTQSELFKLIDSLLDNDDLRVAVARRGCDHVHANHTWYQRIPQIAALTGL